jgi:hypothetical protein
VPRAAHGSRRARARCRHILDCRRR